MASSHPEGRQEGAPAACGSQTGCGGATRKEGGASLTTQREADWDAGDSGVIAESGRSPGGGHGSPLQCSRLGNPWTGVWRATVPGVTKSQTRLSH